MVQATIQSSPRAQVPDEVSAARILLETLADGGVRAAFGIPGGLVSPVYDALRDVPRIRPVTVRHETMAAYAAMGHAVATGTPALCLTTAGPGATNAITGLAAAFAEDIPLIAVAGEVARAQSTRGAVQDGTTNTMDIVAMLRTVTRWSTRVDDPQLVAGAAARALREAAGPPAGPVFMSLPVDVSSAATARPASMFHAAPSPLPRPDVEACRDVAERLARAKRPLLIVGSGAHGATRQVAELARRLGIPVITTPHAKGFFPESDPLHLGIMGFGGHESAKDRLEEGHDVVLVVGTQLGDWATNSWSLPVSGTDATIQIDRDPWLIGRNYPVTVGIVADAAAALSGIIEQLPRDVGRPLRAVEPGVRRRDVEPRSRALHPGRVMNALQAAFPDAFFAVDIGEHCAHALHWLSIDRPDQFRSMVGLAAMGTGIGTAMGARHARRDRPVVGICGDGGFLMYAGEIATCVEHDIDIVLVVMNDGGYNMINHGFERVFGRVPGCLPRRSADLAGVARDLGAIGVRIETERDLHPARLRALTELGGPVVLDVRFDASVALSVESRSSSLQKVAFGGAV
jgi:acetolactate synthase-1/2/3 large subunit